MFGIFSDKPINLYGADAIADVYAETVAFE